MLNARTVLHVLITLAVVMHGAWMAAMPIAHASAMELEAPAAQSQALVQADPVSHSSHDAHDHHGHHAHHQTHAYHSAPADQQAQSACAQDTASDAPAVSHLDAPLAHAAHDHEGHVDGHSMDHDMSGCECTLCKITALAAVETQLALAGLAHIDALPRAHPAQQIRVTTGPPVGLRAPPIFI